MLASRKITDNVCKCTSSIRLSIAPHVKIQYANGQNFVHGGSGLLSVYSNDEKAAINALTDANDDTYYLFLVKNVTKLEADGNNTVVSGYMPVGYQHGFIFEQFDVARAIAHELGHGAFSLHHTFSTENKYVASQGTTTNLMDYNGTTTDLYKYQWDYIHNPEFVLFRGDDEEGEEIKENINYLFKQNYLHTISELKKFKLFRFIYDYIVDSDEKYYGCGGSIESKGKYIDIMEYLKYRKLRSWNNILGFCNQNTLQPHLDNYLKELNEIFKIEEVQKLLYTDYWIDIPIDMWPYK